MFDFFFLKSRADWLENCIFKLLEMQQVDIASLFASSLTLLAYTQQVIPFNRYLLLLALYELYFTI